MTNDIIQFILLLVKFQLDKCLMIFLFRKCKDFADKFFYIKYDKKMFK